MTEGFRFVHREKTWLWVHPNLLRSSDIDCTDMPDDEFESFVETVTNARKDSIAIASGL